MRWPWQSTAPQHQHTWRCVRTYRYTQGGYLRPSDGVRTAAMWLCSECGRRKTTDILGHWAPEDLNV